MGRCSSTDSKRQQANLVVQETKTSLSFLSWGHDKVVTIFDVPSNEKASDDYAGMFSLVEFYE